MMHTVCIRIREEQRQKIKHSGLSFSEYIRNSIDFYDMRKQNAQIYMRLNCIQECINLLEDYKQKDSQKIYTSTNYYNIPENAKKKDEKMQYTKVDNANKNYTESENVSQDAIQFEEEDTCDYEENAKQMCDDPLYPRFERYIPLLSKMLNIHNIIPPHTQSKLKDETATTKRQFDDFIRKYRDEIKEHEYTFERENVRI